MQTQPNKYSQFFLTVVGLVLLVVALGLSYSHPRNEGIASISYSQISQ